MILSIKIIEKPDPENILIASTYMVVDEYQNPWFGANTIEEAQNYINFHN